MAARLNRMHSEQVLERIKLANLVARLQLNALGELTNKEGQHIEMSDGQIRSTVFLLERRLARAEAPKHVMIEGQLTLTQLVEKAAALATAEDKPKDES